MVGRTVNPAMRASAQPASRTRGVSGVVPDNKPEAADKTHAGSGARFAATYRNADGDSVEITGRAMDLFLAMASGNEKAGAQAAPEQSATGTLFPTVAAPGNTPAEIIAPVPVKPGSIPESPETASVKPPGECKTCESRRYVDRSDDSSVSYQTPTKISASMAAAAVASHEQEHVRNERSAADRNDREIVNQTVTLTYDCCPECGKHYVSGGTTRTISVSKAESDEDIMLAAQS